MTRNHKPQPKRISHWNFLSIVRSGRYVRSVNILIKAKFLVSTKCLPTEKSSPTTKCLAFTKFLVIDKHLIVENLSNMTEMSSSNNFWSKKIKHFHVVIFFKTKWNQSWYLKSNHLWWQHVSVKSSLWMFPSQDHQINLCWNLVCSVQGFFLIMIWNKHTRF